MAQVLLFTSPHFRGTITDTPSGTAYHVKPGQTIVADDTDVPLLQTFGFTSAAPSAVIGAALTVSDGSSHTITNVGSIVLGTGGTLSGSGGVGTIDGFGGSGGGGTYANGVGIAFDTITNPGTTTINNTGTIVQPVVSGGPYGGAGIVLRGGDLNGAADGLTPGSLSFRGGYVTAAGTANVASGAYVVLTTGLVLLTQPAGNGLGGLLNIQGSGVYSGTISGGAASIALGNSSLYGQSVAVGAYLHQFGGSAQYATLTNTGGDVSNRGGLAFGGETAAGGSVFLAGGDAAYGTVLNKGGNVSVSPGVGSSSNGILLVSNIGTDDPHVLDAKFQVSVAGVGFVGVYSKG